MFKKGILPFLFQNSLKEFWDDTFRNAYCNLNFDTFCKSPTYSAVFGFEGKLFKIQYKQYLLEAYDEDGDIGYDYVSPFISCAPLNHDEEENMSV